MSKYQFLNRWFVDADDQIALEKHIDWFLDQFPFSLRPIILKLLDKYDFYDEHLQANIYNDYKRKIKEFIEKNCVDNYVITMPFDKDSHNSYFMFPIFKDFKCERDGIVTSRISENELCNYKSIIYVDDYSGTGGSFIDFFESKKNFVSEEAKVFFLPCFMTNSAKEKIVNSKIGNLVTLSHDVTIMRQAKYIEEQHVLNSSELQQLIAYSTDFIRILPSLVRGYGNTEDLISLYCMTPNNTIALFWWIKNTLYYPLFKRNSIGQRINIRHPRFKYSFIKEYNESLKTTASKKMREYLIIAVLSYLGNSFEEIKKQCDFEHFDFDDGVNYLKNTKVLDELLRVSLPTIRTFIDLDRIIIFNKTGVAYNNYSTIKKNLIKNIR